MGETNLDTINEPIPGPLENSEVVMIARVGEDAGHKVSNNSAIILA